MGGAAQVPWDRIIAAAAASTLGVLSLCVILVGVLAYLFFGRSDDRIKLAVFAALLLAVAGLAIAVLRESGRTGAKTGEPGVAIAPSPDVTGAPLVTEPSRQAAEVAAPASATGSAAALARQIAGGWHDDDGYTYRFSADGGRIRYVQLQGGEPVGSGDGTIAGRTLRYRYVDVRTNDHGTCEGQLAQSGTLIDGRCSSGGNSWGFRIERDAA